MNRTTYHVIITSEFYIIFYFMSNIFCDNPNYYNHHYILNY